MRQVVFGCPTLTLRPKTIYIIFLLHIQYVCITLQMPTISAHENQHHIYQYIYIYDLHGPRHIQKTGPKLIAIEPKLIAIPYELHHFSEG